jgi:hypothetical protein
MPARTESWLARNGQLPARIEFCPHEPENDRTERFIGARKWKLSAQIDFDAAGMDFCPHEFILIRVHSWLKNYKSPSCSFAASVIMP